MCRDLTKFIVSTHTVFVFYPLSSSTWLWPFSLCCLSPTQRSLKPPAWPCIICSHQPPSPPFSKPCHHHPKLSGVTLPPLPLLSVGACPHPSALCSHLTLRPRPPGANHLPMPLQPSEATWPTSSALCTI